MIICILGRMGSGKTTIGQALQEVFGCGLVDVSDVVGRVSSLQKDTDGRRKLQEAHLEQIDPDWLANPLLEEVAQYKRDELCIVVGIREPYLLYRLQQKHPAQTTPIYLECSTYTRYMRLCHKVNGCISVVDFKAGDSRDDALGLDITISSAQYCVNAEQSIAEVIKEIELFLYRYGIRSFRKLGEDR